MRRCGVLGVLLWGGCTTDASVAGAWFSELQLGLDLFQEVPEAELHHRALRDHSVEVLTGPLVDGLEIVSSDPAVLRALTASELAVDEDIPEALGPEATLFADFDNDRSGFYVASGEPGIARLSLVNPWTGEEVDTVDVEVKEAATVKVVSAGPWKALDTLEARVLAGTEYNLKVAAFDEQGQLLLGYRGQQTSCRLPASPPGLQVLDCGTIQVVDPGEIVEIELREVSDIALVAVGIDREGWPVLGLPAAWTDAEKPEVRGDAYWFNDEPGGELVEVTATFGELQATTTIYRSGLGQVARSDQHSCSSVGSVAGVLPVLLVLPLLRRRAGPTSQRPSAGS